jgi:uncharacterized membrane protein YqjE
MSEEQNRDEGLLSIVTRLLKTLRETAETRLELFLVEIREDRLKLFEVIGLAVAGIALALMTLIVATFTIVVVFWDSHRLAALLILAGIYGAATVFSFATLRSRLKNWQSFPATIEQLKKDRACFKKPN